MNANDSIIETLKASTLFKEYEQSFVETMKLPVALRPAESWQLPFHRKKYENSFCVLMAGKSKTCVCCLQLQERLAQSAQDNPATVTCSYGLSEFAAAVRQDGKVIGYLQSGQVFQRKPSATQFKAVFKKIQEKGVEISLSDLKNAYFGTPVLPPERISAILRLLAIFAQHLSIKADQNSIQKANAELPQITTAKNFIRDHIGEDLSLRRVAKTVNMSCFYFCKMFTRYAGVHFTKFVAQLRAERARNMLMNRSLAISEIAFEAGFQSLTHFNRIFRKLQGMSPTEFRRRLTVRAK